MKRTSTDSSRLLKTKEEQQKNIVQTKTAQVQPK